MSVEQLTVDNIAQLLRQQEFPTSVEAALMTIRACDMFSRNDLSMLANQFVFGLVQSTTNTTNSQNIWVKTRNNLQELQALNILRQFLDNESDLKISSRVFDIIFVDILNDQNNSLFNCYYDLIFKFISLVLSFESRQTLTIISRWFLNISTSNSSLLKKLIEQIIHQHIALTMSSSSETLSMISPLFTLCFMTETSMAFENERFQLDNNTIETLIDLFTIGLNNSTHNLLQTLKQELLEKNESMLSKFLPSIVQLDVLLPLRSFESTCLSMHFDRFHTSILSFLFEIVVEVSQKIDDHYHFEEHIFPMNYFQQLAKKIQDIIEREGPEERSIDDCVQRYLQIVSICQNSSFRLIQLNLRDLAKATPLITRHKLFDIIKHKEQHESKRN